MNDYTDRQLMKIGEVYFKDKFMVVLGVAKAFVGKSDGLGKGTLTKPDSPTSVPAPKAKPRGLKGKLPRGFKLKDTGRQRRNVAMFDLDGPMDQLAPMVGNVGERLAFSRKTGKVWKPPKKGKKGKK